MMADESQVVTGTPPASGDTATAVPSGETPTTTDAKATDAAPNPAPAPEPKKVDPRQRKIAEMAYEVRELKRQNDRLLGLVERGNAPAQQQVGQPPRIEDFKSIDEFLDARDQYRDRMREQKAPKQEKAQEPDGRVVEAVKAAVDDLRSIGTEKYEDFEEDVFDDNVKFTAQMRQSIIEIEDMDLQAEVAYYLGKNPKEVLRIGKLSPIRQNAAIGRLEERLSAKPQPQKRPSAAPAPIQPVGGSNTPTDEILPTEDYESFLKKRNKQLGRK